MDQSSKPSVFIIRPKPNHRVQTGKKPFKVPSSITIYSHFSYKKHSNHENLGLNFTQGAFLGHGSSLIWRKLFQFYQGANHFMNLQTSP